jgi:PAS domain S-box-containing protein
MRAEDTLALMTWRARPDTSCEYVNRAWLDYTGYTLEEALGEGWARCLHPEDLARWLDACVPAFDARQPFEIEYRLRRKDGAYRWVLDRAAPSFSGDGVFLGYAGSCVEIEDYKRAEQSLSRALERERRLRISTEASSRARQGLTVSLLQELQSPAQAIATWAGHLRDQVPRATDAAQALEAIERNARTQSRIIANYLELSQATALSSAPAGGPLLHGVRVLVVDADRDAREQLLRLLEVAGADVRVAATTQEALGMLGAWQADVVLSEKNDSFIRALRALPAERGGCLRAAELTADTRSALTAGYDAQLAKPVEPVALLATVARLAA